MRDLVYALRRMRRERGVAAAAVLTLALGLGMTAAVFALCDAVLWAPLPYPQPARLMILHDATRGGGYAVSYPNYLDWQRRNRTFTALAAFRSQDALLAGAGSAEPEHLESQAVSANFFSVLGVKLLAGQGFSASADRPGGGCEVVIGYGLWQARFGADPHLVGHPIPLNGTACVVVGILPRSFWFWRPAQLFTPLGRAMPAELMERGTHPGIGTVGRLKPGVSLAFAQADMNGIARDLAREYPGTNTGHGVAIHPAQSELTSGNRPMLLLLFWAVGLVLLIAAANVANLLLAQVPARQPEMAVRKGLGASPARLLRQLLTESVVVAVAGGIVGLGVAWGVLRLAGHWTSSNLFRGQQVGLHAPAVIFSLAAALLVGFILGLIPAWSMRRRRAGRRRGQQLVAVAEVALALMLLAGAGLLIRSLIRLEDVDPGFDSHHILTMHMALSPQVLNSNAAVAADLHDLLTRVGRLPGISAASEASWLPLTGDDDEWLVWPGSTAPPPGDHGHAAFIFITNPGYRRVLGLPLLRGRFLEPQDRLGRQDVVVVDDILAKDLFGDENPIGQHMQTGLGDVQIVGEVAHVKALGLGIDATANVRDELYFPISQVPLKFFTEAGQGMTLAVRTEGDPRAALPMVRAAVAGPGRDQPVYQVQTMDDIIAASLANQRFLMTILAIFAGAALVLAGVGVYGVLAYAAARRGQEFGIRMALGAGCADLRRLVLGEGVRLALAGAAIGIVGAVAAGRLLRADLYGVSAADPLTLMAAAALLVLVALGASYLPARRAARADPAQLLRQL